MYIKTDLRFARGANQETDRLKLKATASNVYAERASALKFALQVIL